MMIVCNIGVPIVFISAVCNVLFITCLSVAQEASFSSVPDLAEELETYLKNTDNLSAKIHVRSYVGKVLNMEPIANEPRVSEYNYEFDLRRIGNSFRYDSLSWKGETNKFEPYLRETSGYDSQSGRQTSYGATDGMLSMDVSHARISPLQYSGAFPKVERFSRFFRGTQTESWNFYIPFLLSHQESATIEKSTTDFLRVSLPLHSVGDQITEGSTSYEFDTRKGNLLSRVEDSYRIGEAHFEHMAIVKDANLVKGVWIPTSIIEVGVMHNVHKPGTGGIFEITISDIRIGELIQKDLEVKLPKNVKVVDNQIDNELYQIDQNGKKELLMQSSTNDFVKTNGEKSWKQFAIFINLVFIGALLVWIWVRNTMQ